MFRILYTKEFGRAYAKVPSSIQRKIEKQEALFRQNPFHPSLHTEKLKPRQHELWSMRVDLNYRIVFRFTAEQSVTLINVGTHDRMYRLRGR